MCWELSRRFSLNLDCTNKNVATVDAKGRIKAKAAGKCTVYVIAVNGTTQAVQIIVK